MKPLNKYYLFAFLFVIALAAYNCQNSQHTSVEPDDIKVDYISDSIETLNVLNLFNKEHNLYVISSENREVSFLDASFTEKFNGKQFLIKLMEGENLVLELPIGKETFRDSLDVESYDQLKMIELEYSAVRSNRLFFKTRIESTTEKKQVYDFEFGIFYQTEKKGQIDFWIRSES